MRRNYISQNLERERFRYELDKELIQADVATFLRLAKHD